MFKLPDCSGLGPERVLACAPTHSGDRHRVACEFCASNRNALYAGTAQLDAALGHAVFLLQWHEHELRVSTSSTGSKRYH